MSPFSFSGLLAFISSLLFGLLVLLKSENKRLGKVWFFFALSVAVWGSGVMIIPYISKPNVSLYVWRLTYAFGANWIAVLFIHFVCIFCELDRPILIIIQYFLGVFFFLISFTPLFYSGVIFVFNSFFYSKAGPLYILNSCWWLTSVIYSHIELFLAYKYSSAIKKNQIRYFFLATAVGFTGASVDFLPPLGIEVYPWGNFTIFLYPIIMSFAMLKYRLMDFNLIVRWGFAYAASFLAIGTVFFAVIYSSEKLVSHLFLRSTGFPTLVLCGILVFIFQPIRKKITLYVDHFIFKSPDFHSLLAGIEEQLKVVTTIQLITSGLIGQFKKIWNVDHAGFAIWNSATSNFELLPIEAFKGQIVENITDQIDRNDFLIKTLETERRLFPFGIVIDDEIINLSTRTMAGERATFAKIRRTLRWLGASVAVPLMLNTDLIGFIILGPKKNNALYNEEDKKFLSHVAEMVSDTVKNIILNQPFELTKLNKQSSQDTFL